MIQGLQFVKKAWIEASVIKIIDATPKVRHIHLQTDPSFRFQPGQYITLDLPVGKKKIERRRTYSIANPPNKKGIIELCISYVQNGNGSEYLFNELVVGDTIRFRGPSGQFLLPKRIDKDLVFICMGSAIAPVRSMIKHIFENKIPHHKVHLIFGAKNRDSLLCFDEFMSLAMGHSDFKYSFTFSRELNPSSEVRRGYVHQIYLEEYAKKKKDLLFYVSGRLSMIEETVENLTDKLGYHRNQVIYETN